MILRSPAIHLEISTKAANQLFSRAVTNHNYHIQRPQNSQSHWAIHNFAAGTEKIPSSSSTNLLDFIAESQQNGFLQKPEIINKTISTCAKLGSYSVGIQMHARVIKVGFSSNVYINSALVNMYSKCGFVSLAHRLFDEMPERSVVTWNSLISGYLDTLFPKIAMGLFIEMLRVGMSLTAFSVSAALVGCAQLEDAGLGAQVHGLGLKFGFGSNVVVGTGLIDMYSKCLNVEASRRMFDGMHDKNVRTWTSLITGYSQNGLTVEAMFFLRDMLCMGIQANYVTYNSLLSSFCHPDELVHCKVIHCRIIREGFESNMYVVVTLMTVYSECGCSLEDLYKICSTIMVWDQISWNAVIAGFSNIEDGEEALVCFSKMRQAGINLDVFTYASILKAIGTIAALEEGKQTHALVFKAGYASNVCVQNGIVSMYAKCGKLNGAKKVFSSMDERDLISWNSLLLGFAYHGYGKEAVELFEEMRRSRVKPNLTTFLTVLSACSHFGLLDKGLEYFELMKNDDSLPPPTLEHYSCIVDLYGRAGHLHEAEAFINNMPTEPGPSVFKALLSACQVHGNKEIAVRTARRLVELSPNDPATYVVLANVLATEGNWNDAAGVRQHMSDRKVRKKSGFSWI